jgi:hypothetical protein
MMSVLELFVRVDDFCQVFLPVWERKLIEDGSKKRHRPGQLSVSEIMTIIIYFHQSQYRNFKAYYTEHVCQHLRGEFPKLVSYERFVILMPSVLGPLSAYLKSLYGAVTGFRSLTQPPCWCVTTSAFTLTRYLPSWLSEARVRWAGFTGSSSIW